jgi:hypothetical protein
MREGETPSCTPPEGGKIRNKTETIQKNHTKNKQYKQQKPYKKQK